MSGDTSGPVVSMSTEVLRAALSGLGYSIRNLMPPLGYKNPVALSVNEFGAVAGKAYGHLTGLVNGDTGVVWTLGLPEIVLPPTVGLAPSSKEPLPGHGSGLNDINWHGVAVGWRERDDATGGDIAIQAIGEAITDIPAGVQARATGINDAGLICGWGILPTAMRGFVYDRASGALRPVGLAGAAGSRATAINNAGEVAGESGGQAFLDSGGKTKALGPVSRVTGVNDAGLVVGSRDRPGGGRVPMTCDARGPTPAWTPIPLLSNLTDGQAEGVNRFGDVVGSCWDGSGLRRAFIHKDGASTDLNLLIDAPDWHLETAYDISDRGQICGIGTFAGTPAAFLLSPPLTLPDLPPLYRKWPIELPDGPPRPEEAALRDASILVRLNQAATAIADSAVREPLRTALFEAARAAGAALSGRIALHEEPAAARRADEASALVSAEDVTT